MSKKTFIVFGLLVVFLAALIPWLAFRADGDAANAEPVPEQSQGRAEPLPDQLRHLPHALRGRDRRQLRAEPRRTAGPLRPAGRPERAADTIKATEGRVLNAIENGVDSSTTPGRMPAGILNEEQAKEVAAFVAATAGEG